MASTKKQTAPFRCECGAVFSSQEDYSSHLLTHESQEDSQPGDESPDATLATSSGGEQGQTEEERRAWKHVREKTAEEAKQ
jgi:hypothetical protein